MKVVNDSNRTTNLETSQNPYGVCQKSCISENQNLKRILLSNSLNKSIKDKLKYFYNNHINKIPKITKKEEKLSDISYLKERISAYITNCRRKELEEEEKQSNRDISLFTPEKYNIQLNVKRKLMSDFLINEMTTSNNNKKTKNESKMDFKNSKEENEKVNKVNVECNSMKMLENKIFGNGKSFLFDDNKYKEYDNPSYSRIRSISTNQNRNKGNLYANFLNRSIVSNNEMNITTRKKNNISFITNYIIKEQNKIKNTSYVCKSDALKYFLNYNKLPSSLNVERTPFYKSNIKEINKISNQKEMKRSTSTSDIKIRLNLRSF